MNLGMLLGSMGVGAGIAYLLDPDRGKRRRTLLYDKMLHAYKRTASGLDTTMRDMRHRAEGVAAEARTLLTEEEQIVSDEVVEQRVRSRLGRFVSHPGAIEVHCQAGRVTLRGPILARELDDLLTVVASIRGVAEVIDKLEPHTNAEHVSSLQGGRARPGTSIDIFQESWSPTTRLLMGTTGGLLMLNCLTRRTPRATLFGTAGFLAFVRAATNLNLRRLFGVGVGRRSVDLQKTVHIDAPVETVYQVWSNVENFPQFMSHVLEVENLGEGRSRWTVEGPAGSRFHWDALVTQQQANRLLCWRTEQGAEVAHAGVIRFEPDRGGTRVDVKMSYCPPMGAVGHAVATLLGRDPKREMDDDLLRMKTFIETHHVPHDAAQP
jgi:uncharacterized membrane protein/gas vesicle protein